MGEIVDLYENKPHKVSIVICLKCYKRWMALRPEETLLQDIQCPQCREAGFVIETGEEFEINEQGGDVL